MVDKFDPNLLKKTLLQATNAAGKAMFHKGHEAFSVKIRPDSKVPPAKFIPDPLIPGGHKAHPVTIAAMRKDIFTAGEEMFADLEQMYLCESCQNDIDLQFWIFCPHCEAQVKL